MVAIFLLNWEYNAVTYCTILKKGLTMACEYVKKIFDKEWEVIYGTVF